MADFPHSTVKILADACTEELIPPEHRIAQSISHKEARDSWGSGFRRRWTINLKLLGTTAQSAIITHYQSMLGRVGTFNFTSPRTGATVLCRYDSPTLVLRYQPTKTTGGYWPAEVSIIEVL